MALFQVGDAAGTHELAVALPVDASSSRRFLDVEDDVLEDRVGEDVVSRFSPVKRAFLRRQAVVVGEEDGEHPVARRVDHFECIAMSIMAARSCLRTAREGMVYET